MSSNTIYTFNELRVEDLFTDLTHNDVQLSVYFYNRESLREIFFIEQNTDYTGVITGIKINEIKIRGDFDKSFNNIRISGSHDVYRACVNVKKLLDTQRLFDLSVRISKEIQVLHADGKDADNSDVWPEVERRLERDMPVGKIVKGSSSWDWLTYDNYNCDHNIKGYYFWYYDGSIKNSWHVSVKKPTKLSCKVNEFNIEYGGLKFCIDKSFDGCQEIDYYKTQVDSNNLAKLSSKMYKMTVVSKNKLNDIKIRIKEYKYSKDGQAIMPNSKLIYHRKGDIEKQYLNIKDLFYKQLEVEESFLTSYGLQKSLNDMGVVKIGSFFIYDGGDICSKINSASTNVKYASNILAIFPSRSLKDASNWWVGDIKYTEIQGYLPMLDQMIKQDNIPIVGKYKKWYSNETVEETQNECVKMQLDYNYNKVSNFLIPYNNNLNDYSIKFSIRDSVNDEFFKYQIIKNDTLKIGMISVPNKKIIYDFDTELIEMFNNRCAFDNMCVTPDEFMLNSCNELINFVLCNPTLIKNENHIDDYKNNEYKCILGAAPILYVYKNWFDKIDINITAIETDEL